MFFCQELIVNEYSRFCAKRKISNELFVGLFFVTIFEINR